MCAWKIILLSIFLLDTFTILPLSGTFFLLHCGWCTITAFRQLLLIISRTLCVYLFIWFFFFRNKLSFELRISSVTVYEVWFRFSQVSLYSARVRNFWAFIYFILVHISCNLVSRVPWVLRLRPRQYEEHSCRIQILYTHQCSALGGVGTMDWDGDIDRKTNFQVKCITWAAYLGIVIQ